MPSLPLAPPPTNPSPALLECLRCLYSGHRCVLSCVYTANGGDSITVPAFLGPVTVCPHVTQQHKVNIRVDSSPVMDKRNPFSVHSAFSAASILLYRIDGGKWKSRNVNTDIWQSVGKVYSFKKTKILHIQNTTYHPYMKSHCVTYSRSCLTGDLLCFFSGRRGSPLSECWC